MASRGLITFQFEDDGDRITVSRNMTMDRSGVLNLLRVLNLEQVRLFNEISDEFKISEKKEDGDAL